MNNQYSFGIGAVLVMIGFLFNSCEKLSPADIVANEMFKRTMELEGTWNLDKVRYTYRTKNGDTWQTDVDETYADASGQITFVYPDSFDFE
ncbi:MAG: hypothetical protein EB157_05490 [Euryarchaeota archaeon]|nr:hypothetical protein [Euryarchaeota archaeon]